MSTISPKNQKRHVVYRFIVANSLYDREVELGEEQIREEFKKSKEIFTDISREGPAWAEEIFTDISREGPAWAAMTIAYKIYKSGYDKEDDWPMILLAMDPLGTIYRIDAEMELRPEITEAKPTKLFEANVDDKTLPMFPNFAEENAAHLK